MDDAAGATPSADAFAKYTGLELLQGAIVGRIPNPPINVFMGFALTEAGHGLAVFTGAPDRRMVNPFGVVQGGYAASLLDSTMGCAIHSTLDRGATYSSIDIHVTFVRPVVADAGVFTARATVMKTGRRVGSARSELYDPQGVLVAYATGAFAISS